MIKRADLKVARSCVRHSTLILLCIKLSMDFNIFVEAISPSFTEMAGSFAEDPCFSSDGKWMFVRTDSGVVFQFDVASYTHSRGDNASNNNEEKDIHHLVDDMRTLEPLCCYDCGDRIINFCILDV